MPDPAAAPPTLEYVRRGSVGDRAASTRRRMARARWCLLGLMAIATVAGLVVREVSLSPYSATQPFVVALLWLAVAYVVVCAIGAAGHPRRILPYLIAFGLTAIGCAWLVTIAAENLPGTVRHFMVYRRLSPLDPPLGWYIPPMVTLSAGCALTWLVARTARRADAGQHVTAWAFDPSDEHPAG